jgi:hypothetical protein
MQDTAADNVFAGEPPSDPGTSRAGRGYRDGSAGWMSSRAWTRRAYRRLVSLRERSSEPFCAGAPGSREGIVRNFSGAPELAIYGLPNAGYGLNLLYMVENVLIGVGLGTAIGCVSGW